MTPRIRTSKFTRTPSSDWRVTTSEARFEGAPPLRSPCTRLVSYTLNTYVHVRVCTNEYTYVCRRNLCTRVKLRPTRVVSKRALVRFSFEISRPSLRTELQLLVIGVIFEFDSAPSNSGLFGRSDRVYRPNDEILVIKMTKR